MGLFGLLNYEDYILNTIVNSNYARNSLIVFFTCVMTAIVRFHLSIIICALFTWNNGFDLIFPILVTILLSMASDTLFKYMETHRPRCEQLVDYLMANYSTQNFIRWKRFILLGICCYVLLAIALVEVDNYFIFLTTIQTIISFVFCDLLENKMPQALYNRLMGWWNRPRVIRFPDKGDIIENYDPCNIDKFNKLDNNQLIKPKRDKVQYKSSNQQVKSKKDKLRRSLDSMLSGNNIRIPSEVIKQNAPNLHQKLLQESHFDCNEISKELPHFNLMECNEPIQIISGEPSLYLERVSPIPMKPPTPPMMRDL